MLLTADPRRFTLWNPAFGRFARGEIPQGGRGHKNFSRGTDNDRLKAQWGHLQPSISKLIIACRHPHSRRCNPSASRLAGLSSNHYDAVFTQFYQTNIY